MAQEGRGPDIGPARGPGLQSSRPLRRQDPAGLGGLSQHFVPVTVTKNEAHVTAS